MHIVDHILKFTLPMSHGSHGLHHHFPSGSLFKRVRFACLLFSSARNTVTSHRNFVLSYLIEIVYFLENIQSSKPSLWKLSNEASVVG